MRKIAGLALVGALFSVSGLVAAAEGEAVVISASNADSTLSKAVEANDNGMQSQSVAPSLSLADKTPRSMPVTKSHGFIDGSTFNVLLRNYFGYFQSDAGDRTAWVQGVRMYYESGYTDGPIGIGFALAPFVALKLNGGRGARNMVHVGPESSAPNERVWAYPGEYALKADIFGLQLRYGMQAIANPFLKPYDNRSLPPTFKGLSLFQPLGASVSLKAGNFYAVNARGADRAQQLTTSYGAVALDRLSYAGLEWEPRAGTKAMIYASKARDLWNQYYVSLPIPLGTAAGVDWAGKFDTYLTRKSGRQLQGDVDNAAFSAAMTGKRGSSSVTFAFQRIASDTFFDFLQETSGIYLTNAMGNDFNAPHEKSVQLRYRYDGGSSRVPGFAVMMWGIHGWGVDGSAGAMRYAQSDSLLHNLYWKNGTVVGGSHQEYGFNPSFTFQSGFLKGAKVLLVLTLHNVSTNYPSKTFRDWRLMADIPIKVF